MVPQQGSESELTVSMHGIWLTLGALHATKLGRIIASAHALLVRVSARAYDIRLVTLVYCQTTCQQQAGANRGAS